MSCLENYKIIIHILLTYTVLGEWGRRVREREFTFMKHLLHAGAFHI